MKKLLCLFMTAVMLTAGLCVSAFHTSAAADDSPGYLTITDDGRVLAQVPVGNVFLYSVGLCAGEPKLQNGQGELHFDSAYAEPVPYGPVKSDGTINQEAYCFPQSIRNASLFANFDLENVIKYNFARMNGFETFNDVNKHYFKIRFKAVAPGTVEIRHKFYSLYSYDKATSTTYRLYFLYKANQQLDPIPYTLSRVELARGLMGDADGDNSLTVMDASLIQYLTAGADREYDAYNADVDADGDIDLHDAAEILRYRAGMTVSSKAGEWIFDSEQV